MVPLLSLWGANSVFTQGKEGSLVQNRKETQIKGELQKGALTGRPVQNTSTTRGGRRALVNYSKSLGRAPPSRDTKKTRLRDGTDKEKQPEKEKSETGSGAN